jgi:hypothetical protein
MIKNKRDKRIKIIYKRLSNTNPTKKTLGIHVLLVAVSATIETDA